MPSGVILHWDECKMNCNCINFNNKVELKYTLWKHISNTRMHGAQGAHTPIGRCTSYWSENRTQEESPVFWISECVCSLQMKHVAMALLTFPHNLWNVPGRIIIRDGQLISEELLNILYCSVECDMLTAFSLHLNPAVRFCATQSALESVDPPMKQCAVGAH